MLISISLVNGASRDAFYKLAMEYLPDTEPQLCESMRALYPGAFLVMQEEEAVIGVAYGWPRAVRVPGDPSFTLQGICVTSDRMRMGYGTMLLRSFERNAFRMGFGVVGVGSAPGYPELFYLRNGYRPVCYKTFDPSGACHIQHFDSTDAYRMFDRDAFRHSVNGDEGFVVFEKQGQRDCPEGEKMLICCIGDSLTEGDYGMKGVRGIPNVHREGYPYFLAELTGAEVRNYGRCGWRASDILRWYREGGFAVSGADKIVICLGTNGGHSMDEDTEDNRAYDTLIDLLREEAPQADIYLCTPPHVTEDPSYINCGYAPHVRVARSFVRMLAEKKKTLLIDLANDPHFTADTEDVMQPNDGLHFSRTGYSALAGVIASAIMPADALSGKETVK